VQFNAVIDTQYYKKLYSPAFHIDKLYPLLQNINLVAIHFLIKLKKEFFEMEKNAFLKRYALFLSNIQDVVWTRDLNLKITFVSPSIKNLLGYTNDEYIKIDWKDSLTKNSQKTVTTAFEKELAVKKNDTKSNRFKTIETEMIHKNGSLIWVETKVTFLRNTKSETIETLSVSRDITEKKQLKVLSGLLPICANCKNVRDDRGGWHQIESYIKDRSKCTFTHGICPDCAEKLYPEFYHG